MHLTGGLDGLSREQETGGTSRSSWRIWALQLLDGLFGCPQSPVKCLLNVLREGNRVADPLINAGDCALQAMVKRMFLHGCLHVLECSIPESEDLSGRE